MVTKNINITILALLCALPIGASESTSTIWSHIWKRSTQFVKETVINISQINENLTTNQRYALAATVGLAAVGIGYAWYNRKKAPQEKPVEPRTQIIPANPGGPRAPEIAAANIPAPEQLVVSPVSEMLSNPNQNATKKSVRFSENNQIKAIPTRAATQKADIKLIQSLHEFQKAVAADVKAVSTLISRQLIKRPVTAYKLETVQVWRNNLIDLQIKDFSKCYDCMEFISGLPQATNLEQLQELQRQISILARELIEFIKRFKANIE